MPVPPPVTTAVFPDSDIVDLVVKAVFWKLRS
jgi:hypothetical protein